MKIIKKFLFIAGFFFFLIPVNTFANEGQELAEQIYTVSETEDISIEKIETGYYISEVDCIFTTDMLGYYIEVCDGVNTYLLDVEGNTYETDGILYHDI